MKRILAILLALCMVLALAACGANKGGETEPSTTAATEPKETEAALFRIRLFRDRRAEGLAGQGENIVLAHGERLQIVVMAYCSMGGGTLARADCARRL